MQTSTTSAAPAMVSIALATFNAGDYLYEQLDSLLAQDYANIEIVISDDGSTDQTTTIIREYQQRHPNIFLYKNEKGSGIRQNFENAMEHCNGKFIALCDQDDWWLPAKISSCMAHIGSNDMIYHNSLFVDPGRKSLGITIADQYHMYEGKDARYFLQNNCISGHACLFRATLLQTALPLPAARFHDWWLAFIAASGNGIAYLEQVLVHYRQHEKSKTDILLRRNDYKHAGMDLKFREEREWFHRAAKIKSNQQAFFEKWYMLFAASEKQWLSFGLFFLTLRNRNKIFYISRKSGAGTFIASLKHLPGLKLKKRLRG